MQTDLGNVYPVDLYPAPASEMMEKTNNVKTVDVGGHGRIEM